MMNNKCPAKVIKTKKICERKSNVLYYPYCGWHKHHSIGLIIQNNNQVKEEIEELKDNFDLFTDSIDERIEIITNKEAKSTDSKCCTIL